MDGEKRGGAGRSHRTLEGRGDGLRLVPAGCDKQDFARRKNRLDPHRQGLARDGADAIGFKALPRRAGQWHAQGSRRQRAARLEVGHVPVDADADQREVGFPRCGQLSLVSPALALRIGGVAAKEVNVLGQQIDLREEVALHKATEAARVLRRNAQLVQIEGLGPPEGSPPEAVEAHKLAVNRKHRFARRENENVTSRPPKHPRQAIGRAPCDLAGAREHSDQRIATSRTCGQKRPPRRLLLDSVSSSGSQLMSTVALLTLLAAVAESNVCGPEFFKADRS